MEGTTCIQLLLFFVVLAISITALIGFVKSIILFFPYWLRFWSYKEVRMMFAACAVICFAFLMTPSKIEIKIIHEFSTNYGKPVELRLKLSDPGLPIKLDVTNR